jgi:uncharacterized protein with FMN-binding domain
MKRLFTLLLCTFLIAGVVVGCTGTEQAPDKTEQPSNETQQTPDKDEKEDSASSEYAQDASGTAENLKDGTYEAESTHTKHGWYKGKITIENGKYTSMEFIKYDSAGKEVDLKQYTHKPVVDAMEQLPKELIELQDAGKIDAISSATSTYNEFLEIIAKIREQASQ